MDRSRRNLDNLFLLDANLSLLIGLVTLLSPHRMVAAVSEFGYNHGAHEVLRLYGCLKIAVSWILYWIREVDDGRFRRAVCEALGFCYAIQTIAIIRAQFTDRHTLVNWLAILVFSFLCGLYLNFRYGKGGNLIKVYELPSSTMGLA